jgi:hypothetical protein
MLFVKVDTFSFSDADTVLTADFCFSKMSTVTMRDKTDTMTVSATAACSIATGANIAFTASGPPGWVVGALGIVVVGVLAAKAIVPSNDKEKKKVDKDGRTLNSSHMNGVVSTLAAVLTFSSFSSKSKITINYTT